LSNMRNVYFSDEAWDALEKTIIYEDGKILRRSAKINRIILDKTDKLRNKQQHDLVGIHKSLCWLHDEFIKPLKHVQHADFYKRFEDAEVILATLISNIESGMKKPPNR